MEEVRGVTHGRPAGSAPLTLAGGRAAVDNSARTVPQGIEPYFSDLECCIEIKTGSRGLQERFTCLAPRCDCARISDLWVEDGASWP